MATVNQAGAIAKKATAAPTKSNGKNTLQHYIEAMKPQIAKALPSVMTPERFTRIVTTAISTTPKLAQCDPASFLGAMMQAAQLGVEPNTILGQAYLIPFNNNRKGTIDCQFQLGVKGMKDLAYRSGETKYIGAEVVYENDEFEYELGLNPILKHKPARTNRGKAIYYYAVFKLKNGGEGFQVMSKEDVLEHAKKYSKSFNSGPWQTNFDEMAKKTVLKKLLKYAPMSTEFVRAVATDETTSTFNAETGETNINMEDIFDVEATPTNVNEETGEVKE